MFRHVAMAASSCLLLLLAPRLAAAATDADYDGALSNAPAQRRSDVTIGAELGPIGAAAAGYPNEIGKLDNPEYRASTGFGLGQRASLWLGGALRDWFTFGIGIDAVKFQHNGYISQSSGFIFRVEAYPAFAEGGVWRDLGLAADFGLAAMKLTKDGTDSADGGSMSLVGLGAFWETWRPGSFAIGPSLEYQYLFSPSMQAHSVLLGFRFAFYGGP